MVNKTIDTLMEANGYDEFVCDLFQDWEFVKDEMLIPERKTGSGNGTVHIYLLQSNLMYLQRCFPDYVTNMRLGQNISDDDCPVVEHFCQVSNLVALASYTYHYLGCNELSFNLIDYLKELLALEQNGFLRFESVFKLSTDERPYFKRFSKKVFTRLVRVLFIGEKTAYRIKLYRNSRKGTVAAYWNIGLTIPSPFVISSDSLHPESMFSNDEEVNDPASSDSKNSDPVSNLAGFKDFILSSGKKESTFNGYVQALDKILPRLIRENLDPSFGSVFDTVDLLTLLDMENTLWKCGPIREYDETGHRQLSAGFHRYLEYAQTLVSDEELGKILFSKPTP